MKHFVRRWLAAVTVVTLFFSGYITSLDWQRERFFRHWDHSDSIIIVLDILFLSLSAAVLSFFLDRIPLPGLKRGYRHVFLFSFGLSLTYAIPWAKEGKHATLCALLLPLVAGVVGFSLGRPNSRLPVYAANLCFIASSLPLLLLAPMFFWDTWSSPLSPLPTAGGKGPTGTPVFFFVFDEWSYTRCTSDNQFLASLPNLQELANQSFFFREAYTPGATTHRSLPMTIYQSNNIESLPNVFVGRKERPHDVKDLLSVREEQHSVVTTRPSTDAGSGADVAPSTLFELARHYGYRSYLLGFYLPYGRMLGDRVDWCRAYYHYPRGDSLTERMAMAALETMRYGSDVVSLRTFRPLYLKAFSRHWLEMHAQMRRDLDALIDNTPDRSFCFIHFPLPHAPFFFEADGTYHGDLKVDFRKAHTTDDDIMAGGPEDYMRNVHYLDRLVGDIIARLKTAGKYDEALLIMTSDHSWRYDPDPRFGGGPEGVFHVPLLVKLPEQRSGQVVDSPFGSSRLKPLIENVLRGRVTCKQAADLFLSSPNHTAN